MKVIMTGGGTGGHIYPAIAIADKIKKREPDAEILFVGGLRGMEGTLVPNAGYTLETVRVSGFNRKNLFKNFKTLSDLGSGLKSSLKIMDTFKPDIVIGTGGYVCGPVILAAKMRGIKTAIHEQNAYPGITNKILGKFVDQIFLAFKESEKFFEGKKKVVITGNPLRKGFTIADSETDRKKLGIREKDFMILCFAGSGGAAKVNDAMIGVIREVCQLPEVKLHFATGKNYYDKVIDSLKEANVAESENVKITEYINDMTTYISAADIVICRAGALTISELTACGKPAILIPSPNVTANHQFHNAKVVESQGGAIILEEKDLTGEKLASAVMKLKTNKEALNKMGKGSRKLGVTNAAEIIYDEIKTLK